MDAITSNPEIMSGQWCIAGTRIPVRAIKAFHKAGYSIEGIIKEYPTLTPAQVRDAIAFKHPPAIPPQETPPQGTHAMTDYSELERLAKAATPGLWRVVEGDSICRVVNGATDLFHTPGVYWQRLTDEHRANTAFIAAANPQAILALTKRVKELEDALKPTHRHVKTGGEYHALGVGFIQSETPLKDMDEVMIYRSIKNGKHFARKLSEFVDGKRFAALSGKGE